MERVLRSALPNGRFVGVTAARARLMRSVRSQDNRTTERRLRMALVSRAISGWQLRPKSVQGRPDLYFPAQQLAIFVDGCFWHGCAKCGHVPTRNSAFWAIKLARNRDRDISTNGALVRDGIAVLRFWEHELRDSLPGCVEAIRTKLAKLRHGRGDKRSRSR